jgi:hypothetical protein
MSWTFLTNHAQVLLAITAEPRITARAIAARVDLIERAVQRIIADLEAEGYLTRAREGRSNVYQVDRERPMRHPAQQGLTVAGCCGRWRSGGGSQSPPLLSFPPMSGSIALLGCLSGVLKVVLIGRLRKPSQERQKIGKLAW